MDEDRDRHSIDRPDPARNDDPAGSPPARPALLPRMRWARLALALLITFTLIRGGIWSMTHPYFWAPDEDYHFLYVEYLTTHKSIIDPHKPLYPQEYVDMAKVTYHDEFAAGPRKTFSGDPKASVRKLDDLSASDRDPRFAGRGIGVVHAPLYYVVGALVDWSLDDSSALTRIAAIRWVSVVLGALAIYFAWLLAAQVFRREWLRLVAAFLVAVQPMIAFLSGIVSNDIAVIATFNAALAMMLFMLRTAPRARQGLWLGGAVAIGLLVKSTALALIPLAGLVYVGQGLVHRGRWREVARSAALALGIVLVVSGWWYVRSKIVYGSFTGATVQIVPQGPHLPVTLGNIWSFATEWTKLTYRTYWWHYLWFEAPRNSALYFVPIYVGAIGILGLGAYLIENRRALFAAGNPRVRQIVLMVLAALILYLPPLAVDVARRFNGQGFELVAGRFLLPAYAAVAVLLLIGLRQIVRRRYFPWAVGGLAALAAFFCWRTYTVNYLHRYFGYGSWHELFRRLSFDRPEFVTPTTYTLAFLLLFASLIAGIVVMFVGMRRSRNALMPPERERELAIQTPGVGTALASK